MIDERGRRVWDLKILLFLSIQIFSKITFTIYSQIFTENRKREDNRFFSSLKPNIPLLRKFNNLIGKVKIWKEYLSHYFNSVVISIHSIPLSNINNPSLI